MAGRRIPVLVSAVLLLTVVGGWANVAGQEDRAGKPVPFSRSKWIARFMSQLPSSGGALPIVEPLPLPLAAGKGLPGPALDFLTAEPVRVNSDLLASDTVAQPGTQAEPYIHVNSSDPDNLLACWQENRFQSGGARALNYAVSFDGGLTWTEGILPHVTPVTGGSWEKASDPWVAFGPSNRAYFVTLLFNETTPDNAIGVSVSTDGGLTWGPPIEVFRSNNFDFNDKEAMTVDTNPASPFFGNVYVTWDTNIASGDRFVAQRLVVARSTDGGLTYKKPVKVRGKGVNVGVVPRVGPEGTLYLIWAGGSLESSKLKIFFSSSTDGGVTWNGKKKIARIRSRGIGQMRTGEFLPSFAVDANTGDLYVAWQDARLTGVDQATLMISRDGGRTWSDLARVSDGPDDAAAFTISVATNASGDVAVSYYSLQNDPQRRFLVDKYVRISRDGGRSFEPSLRVTRTTSDARFAAQTRGGFFLGDYVGLAGAANSFHLLWVDTSRTSPATGLPQPDVFTASVR